MSGGGHAASGELALVQAAARYTARLGDRLLAAYALGSLVHGGFSEAVSDIDLGLILSDPLRTGDAELIRTIAVEASRTGEPLDSRLSVFWGTPSTLCGEREGGRFPALDRLDLIAHGRLISGNDRARHGLPSPSAAELLVAGARFALQRLAGFELSAGGGGQRPDRDRQARARDPVEELRSPELLIAGGVRYVTKTVLFPVRFLFTSASGQVATNDGAVEGYLARSDAPSHALVAAARAWRMGEAAWEAQAARLLRLELVPLYAYYIDDHVVHLGNLGEHELMRSFRVWRNRLLEPSQE